MRVLRLQAAQAAPQGVAQLARAVAVQPPLMVVMQVVALVEREVLARQQ